MFLKFLIKVVVRLYWYFDKVIKEPDPFMQFWYAAFAFTVLVSFYIFLGIVLFDMIANTKLIDKLLLNSRIYTFYFLNLLIFLSIVFSNKNQIVSEYQKKSNSFYKSDLWVVLFILGGIVSMFMGPYLSKYV